ncbi:glycosyltransferase [Methylomonas sp. HYX-M1]|uniref:glycosyltransferase n=1 Tax=Methylomonas sp. HYX-M1 TaxID=3139307 RepID=UPI00345C52AF
MKVCFLIPAYNNQDGLNCTLDSISQDDYLSTTIFVYDDGSPQPLKTNVQCGVHMVELIRSEANFGVAHGLNTILDISLERRFDYALRIDAGDIYKLGRLKVQLDYLTSNTCCAVLGGGADIIDQNGAKIGEFSPPITKKELLKAFRCGYPLSHPTVAFRLDAFRKNNWKYPVEIKSAQDIYLFYDIFSINNDYVSNVQDSLIEYVRSDNSIGVRKARAQAFNHLKARVKHVEFNSIQSIIGVLDPGLWCRVISPKLAKKINSIRTLIKSAY